MSHCVLDDDYSVSRDDSFLCSFIREHEFSSLVLICYFIVLVGRISLSDRFISFELFVMSFGLCMGSFDANFPIFNYFSASQ